MIRSRETFFRRASVALGALTIATSVPACSIYSPPTTASGGPPTYYISPSGNDAAAGTSPATAWRTLHKASNFRFPPGTRVLLQGGKRFDGQLKLGARDGGNASNPVVIGSYGNGDATILPVDTTGISVYNTSGIQIQNLNLVGQLGSDQNNGINVFSTKPAGQRLQHIVISRVSVTGFLNGIAVGGTNPGAGFSDVTISDSDLHGNLDSGLITFGPNFNPNSPTYANQDVNVSGVAATGNLGDPANKATDTGNGIVLGSVQDGTITWSTASGNGGRGGGVLGPAGIWTYDSTHVDIAHDLSHGTKTPNQVDGNGFGLDQNTSDSVLQDDLSYGNAGTGYLVYSSLNDRAQKDNVVRDNISSGDARDGTGYYGGITVIGWVSDSAVYQNTVVMTPAGSIEPPAMRLGPEVRGISARNNIFSTESGPLVAVASAIPTSAALFQGNDYHAVDGSWQVTWGSSVYTSLAEWQAGTSEEVTNGHPSGFDVGPEMVGPVLGLNAQSPTDTSASAGFALIPHSPLIGAGLDLAALGLNPASTDYAGHAQSQQHPNLGAE
jgi:hypothetical protein